MTHTRQQLIRDRVRLQSQLDSFLEEARIKLSSHLSDLLGLSGRLMLQALAEGGTDPAKIAELATQGVEATQEELRDALSAAATLNKLQRRILKLFLERLTLLEKQIDVLEKSAAEALRQHQDAVRRLAEMPGLERSRRSRSSRRWGRKLPHSLRRHNWHRGWGAVRGGKKARKSQRATGLRRETGRCGHC